MKKGLFAFVLASLFALSSRAVSIYWYTEEDEASATSAQLVYYAADSDGLDFNDDGTVKGATEIVDVAGFDHTTAYEVGYNTDVSTAYNSGTWYVVLFNESDGTYKATDPVAANSSLYFNDDLTNPTSFSGGGMSGATWMPTYEATPEPCSVALLLLGAAAVAARRKKLIA